MLFQWTKHFSRCFRHFKIPCGCEWNVLQRGKYVQIRWVAHTFSHSPLMEFGKIGYPGQHRIEKQLRESMSVENLLGYIEKNHGNT